MKHKFTFICLLCFYSLKGFTQDCDLLYSNWNSNILIDSINFDSTSTKSKFIIDTTFINNSWEISPIVKYAFMPKISNNALQTLQNNPYNSNDTSAVVYYLDSNFQSYFDGRVNFVFKHTHQMDSGHAYGKLQITTDSGKVWNDLVSTYFSGMGQLYYKGSLNGYTYGGLPTNGLLFTGTSNGYIKEELCFVFFGIKGVTIPKAFGFRFLFYSDSTYNNSAAGWAIAHVSARTPNFISNINGSKNLVQVVNNPIRNGLIELKNINETKGVFTIMDIAGKVILQKPIAPFVYCNTIPPGNYLYKVVSSKGYFLGSGKLFFSE